MNVSYEFMVGENRDNGVVCWKGKIEDEGWGIEDLVLSLHA